jgi:excinuclease ABC subunit C
MRLRDEAHRFAITYHKSLRLKKLRTSELDGITGIGEAKKRALLKHFGSLKRVKLASVEELCKVSGITKSLAESIRAELIK